MPNHDHIEVFVLQLISRDDWSYNLQRIEFLLQHQVAPQREGHLALICLPENALFFRLYDEQLLPTFTAAHPALLQLQDWARRLKAYIHIGSVAWQNSSAEKPGNSSVTLNPQGHIISIYNKLHLFDIQLLSGTQVCESNTFQPGQAPCLLETEGWKWGQSICYDIRFAELFSYYYNQGAHGMLIPSSFLVETGRAHWHILNRARAIESQAYVISAAQAGEHLSLEGSWRKSTFGHSLIVDPWGHIVAEGSGDQEEVLHSRLGLEAIERVRRQIPTHRHRHSFFHKP
jgi:predicted amidohydrolase